MHLKVPLHCNALYYALREYLKLLFLLFTPAYTFLNKPAMIQKH